MSILSDIARGLSINPAEAYVSGQRAAQQQRAGELANVLRGQQIQRNALQVAQAQAARQELAQLGQALAQRAPEIMGDDPRLPAIQDALRTGNPEMIGGAYNALLQRQQARALGQPKIAEIDGQRVFASFDPNTEQMVRIPGATPPERGPLVEVQAPKTQSAEDEAIGKGRGQRFNKLRDRADNAASRISELQVLAAIPAQTGKTEQFQLGILSYADGLGVPLSDATRQRVVDGQTFNAQAERLLNLTLNTAKGPQTDEDARRVRATLAGIDKLQESNNFLIKAAIALNLREVEQVEFLENYRDGKGNLEGANAAWAAHKQRTPLLVSDAESGRPVFMQEFVQTLMTDQGFTREAALERWRDYARR